MFDIPTALSFLCLGVIVQLLIGESLLGWDPVRHIQDAGPSFIGVIALVVLYLLFLIRNNQLHAFQKGPFPQAHY